MPKRKTSPNSHMPLPALPSEMITEASIPIVGIGASAGGLEAFEQFFRLIPIDSGIAFVLVPHLDPDHASMLADILGRVTKMPVLEAQNQIMVMPDHVYIIPPNREMAIFHQKIELTIPDPSHGNRMKIDLFFRSLAEEQGDKAIGVVLSGTGTDGTLGLRAIQGGGGITFVQDPMMSKYDGMPTSAIKSGYATYVLPVEKMPDQIINSVKNLFGERSPHHRISVPSSDSEKTGIIS